MPCGGGGQLVVAPPLVPGRAGQVDLRGRLGRRHRRGELRRAQALGRGHEVVDGPRHLDAPRAHAGDGAIALHREEVHQELVLVRVLVLLLGRHQHHVLPPPGGRASLGGRQVVPPGHVGHLGVEGHRRRLGPAGRDEPVGDGRAAAHRVDDEVGVDLLVTRRSGRDAHATDAPGRIPAPRRLDAAHRDALTNRDVGEPAHLVAQDPLDQDSGAVDHRQTALFARSPAGSFEVRRVHGRHQVEASGRDEVVLESRKQVVDGSSSGVEQEVWVLALWYPAPMLGIGRQLVPLEHQHFIEVWRERPGRAEPRHAPAEHHRRPAEAHAGPFAQSYKVWSSV